jgi:hypothetical protein
MRQKEAKNEMRRRKVMGGFEAWIANNRQSAF